MNSKNILIVDDEKMVHTILEKVLIDEGFKTINAYNGDQAMALLKTYEPILILLDILMPESDGVEICRKMRKMTNVPIIFITSKTTLFDKAMCFGAGSDDYITKPFETEDILMRVKAHLSRFNELTERQTQKEQESVISYPPLYINIDRHFVSVNDVQIPLTSKEFKILETLAKNPNRFYSSEELILRIWNSENTVDNNSLMSHISKIRKKLSNSPNAHDYIVNVRNVGYKFNL